MPEVFCVYACAFFFFVFLRRCPINHLQSYLKCIKPFAIIIDYSLSIFFFNAMLKKFSLKNIIVVNDAAAMAEELVSNFYKMSESQWLSRRYDIKTLADLKPYEIVRGPFAQVIRFKGQRNNRLLGSSTYDFYKICIQDHAILGTLKKFSDIKLFPFTLYIIAHELIHIVRFSKFLQSFDASPAEKMAEETRVHEKTGDILEGVRVSGINVVLNFYKKWSEPVEEMQDLS